MGKNKMAFERALRKLESQDNKRYELICDNDIEILSAKAVKYVSLQALTSCDYVDLYVEVRKKPYIVKVSAVEEGDVCEIGISVDSLENFINQFGNYDDIEDYYEEEDDGKVYDWKMFK